MKKRIVVFAFLVLASMCTVLAAQQRDGGGARGGGGGGGRGGPPPVPAATGPMLEVANKLADAINKQDAATLQKMVAPDAVYLDEDGHAPPAMAWVNRLTMGTPAKQITISQTHGQSWADTGWVSFNYSLTETFQGQPRTLKGTASLVLKKAAGGDWLIQLVHGALEQHVANLTQ